MHHFFVTPEQVDTESRSILLQGSDINHIKNVLRMKQGESVLISDGSGQDYVCRLSVIENDRVVAGIVEQQFEGTELSSKIYLFQGLPKSDKMEWIIMKAVELGVAQIIPVKTDRTVVKFDSKKEEAKIKRWNSIACSAAEQSRRSVIPKVMPVMGFKEAVDHAADLSVNLIPYENYKDMRATKELIREIGEKTSIGIFIGPEGGFSTDEIAYAMAHGIQPITLGKRILRTETAGMMIISVIMFQLELSMI